MARAVTSERVDLGLVDRAEPVAEILEDRRDAVRWQREGVGVAIPDRPRGLGGRGRTRPARSPAITAS